MPQVTFAVESFKECLPEMKALLVEHWKEIASDHELIPLDPCYDEYFVMEDQGMLSTCVARCEGKMVGYHLSFIRPHLHYRQTLSAIVDIYFVLPEFRGGTGYRLFQFVEKTLRERGVKKIFTACKLAHDVGPLFERLGYKEHERLYTKVLL